jgi:hypothetical protein
MLSRKTLASVLVLASLALAGAAHAEVTGVKLNLTPYAGITLWDQLVKLEEKAIYGGRVGLQFGPSASRHLRFLADGRLRSAPDASRTMAPT